ncbi:putative sodium:solute symporter [Escherichia coli]|uniref:Putative sodium:solute symporter n=1 Tax=Escherichia coli TaxID=562 RepID=A0A377AJZ8_ECOLX|nr:putative sodium:solute symporter [Escherichia coli]
MISTFNGFLNSASTLFSMGIYRRIINQNAEPQQLVTVGRKFGFFIAIVSVLVAPWIANAPQGLYSWMKQLNGIYNVPLVTIIIMGFFFPRIPALAAKVAMGIGHNQLHHHQLSGEVRLPFPLCAGLYVLHQRGRDAGESVLSNRAPRRSPSKMRLRWT